ncbi:MAG TPA: trypsin-like serine protease [Polyangiaceae bacterium]|nr:trypsin-like serine protease [Polyangiaceae bacterium]
MVVSAATGVTYRCTGTLIAHNLVITARHCVSDFDELPFTCTSDGELTPNSKGGRIRSLYQPSQVSVRVGDGPNPAFGAQAAQLLATETTTICRNDVALILLDRELTDLPISPIRLKKGTKRGEELRVVGYGADETGNTRIRHTRSGLVVSMVGPSPFQTEPDMIPPRTFSTEGPALCIGDSGGPAFADQTVLTGIWSQVVGDCTAAGARNYFTDIGPFANDLILPAFKTAGADPWYEGTTGPGAVSTGGMGSAGDTSTGGSGGDGQTETGGSGGSAGESSGGAGGDPTTSGGRATGGTDATGGTETSGGSATGGSTSGLRKKGGCTCSVVGTPSGQAEWALAPLAALALLHRRLRRRDAGLRDGSRS